MMHNNASAKPKTARAGLGHKVVNSIHDEKKYLIHVILGYSSYIIVCIATKKQKNELFLTLNLFFQIISIYF